MSNGFPVFSSLPVAGNVSFEEASVFFWPAAVVIANCLPADSTCRYTHDGYTKRNQLNQTQIRPANNEVTHASDRYG